MKSTALVLCFGISVAAMAQTAAKPSTPATKPSSAAAKPASASSAAAAAVVKYPPGKKPDPAVKKTLFSLRVQDLKIGTGAEAEPLKMYKVKYTGWRAADGVVFDSWDQHPAPVIGEDGKPVMGDDGKPKTKAPEPASFPVGMGRMIPGFDQGFAGMRVGGIRRIFIPWQLGYGSRAIPDRTDHAGIPAKSDLVFDVELVDITDMPASPHTNIPHGIPPGGPGGAAPPKPATPGQPAAPGQPSTPPSGAPPAGAPPAGAPPAGAPPAGAPPSGEAPSTPPATSQPTAPPPSSQPSTPPPAN
jgi:peptidylprolyl isomerase